MEEKNVEDIEEGDVFQCTNSLGLTTEWYVLKIYNKEDKKNMIIKAQPTIQCMSYVKEKVKLFTLDDISKILE